jgi:hypothetical protein
MKRAISNNFNSKDNHFHGELHRNELANSIEYR